MKPTEQKLSYFWEREGGDSFTFYCSKLIKQGWVIHQIVPHEINTGNFYLMLYKY